MPWAGTNERAIAIAPLTSLLTFPPLTVILQRSSSFSPTLIAHTTARGHLRLYIGSTSSLIPHSSFLPQSLSPLLQLPVFTVDPTSPYVSSVRLTTVFTVRSTTSYHYRQLQPRLIRAASSLTALHWIRSVCTSVTFADTSPHTKACRFQVGTMHP